MKKGLVTAIVLALGASGSLALAQETAGQQVSMQAVAGTWQNQPDEGAEGGTFEVTIDANNAMSAKIIKVASNIENPKCVKCTGALKDAPIIGLQILNKLPYEGDDVWTNGQILDPESGKFYKVKMTLQDGGKKLKVRGYIGAPAFGRTQYWVRVK